MTRRVPWFVTLCLLGAVPVWAAVPALLTDGSGRDSSTGLGASMDPVISEDGRVAAFVSAAPNLVAGDGNGQLDVFVREVTGDGLRLVSVAVGGGSGRGRSHSPVLSGDGRWVAFVSDADNLVAGDTNGVADVFVRDLREGVTQRVSVGPEGSNAGFGAADRPRITPDGRFVLFERWVRDLRLGTIHADPDLFLRDLVAGVTRKVSGPSVSFPPPPGQPRARASAGVVSDDGGRVVFVASGGLLASAPRDNRCPLYVYDTGPGVLRMVDLLPADRRDQSIPTVANPVLSPDGRWLVAHVDFLQASHPAGLYRIDLDGGAVEAVAPDLDTRRPPGDPVGSQPAWLAADGGTVVFEGRPVSGSNRSMSAVYAGAPGRAPALLSTNLAWIHQPARALPVGRLVAVNRTAEYVAFVSHDPLPEGATQNGPLRLYVMNRLTGETRRVHGQGPGEGGGAAAVSDAAYSQVAGAFRGDGRQLVFQSGDPTLVAGDGNGAPDVFVYDWDSDRVACLSVRSADLASSTVAGAAPVEGPRVSADGRRLAWVRAGRGVDATGRAPGWEIVWQDLETGQVRVVDGSGTSGPRGAWDPGLSADGRWLVFTSAAGGVTVPGPAAGGLAVYRLDGVTGETVWVSRPAAGVTDAGRGKADQGRPSPDGRRVAFTTALPLVPEDRGTAANVYVWDQVTAGLTLVSRSVVVGGGNRASGNPGWSPDGRWLTFQSMASDLTTNVLTASVARWYAWDPETGGVLLLGPTEPGSTPTSGKSLTDPGAGVVFSREGGTWALQEGALGSPVLVRRVGPQGGVWKVPAARHPRLDGSGRLLAYQDVRAGSGSYRQILVRDLETGLDVVGSLGADGVPAPGGANWPELSADGRFLFFTSSATNLHPAATGGRSQAYVRDLSRGVTLLLSGNGAGEAGDSKVVLTRLLPDGRTLLFATAASNLDARDFNDAADFYRVRVEDGGEGPLLSITRVGVGGVVLVWAARDGARDRVEYRPDAEGGVWSRLDVPVVVEGGQARAEDPAAGGGGRRFYRVVRE